ncbi:hypothetical protein Poly51_47620 [Rubripirellula tenax]|uniref:Uncharacterized protein n=1 Tax=Rubripirellula tenax TaxID=2528015 RepID=A0A5C6EJ68_9BACT|nr:hypothetical protein Poly51_47620 [Rubripirellula tenax]
MVYGSIDAFVVISWVGFFQVGRFSLLVLPSKSMFHGVSVQQIGRVAIVKTVTVEVSALADQSTVWASVTIANGHPKPSNDNVSVGGPPR